MKFGLFRKRSNKKDSYLTACFVNAFSDPRFQKSLEEGFDFTRLADLVADKVVEGMKTALLCSRSTDIVQHCECRKMSETKANIEQRNHDSMMDESSSFEKQWQSIDVRTREISLSLDGLKDDLRSMNKVIQGLSERTDRYLTNPGYWQASTGKDNPSKKTHPDNLKRKTDSPLREVETGLLELESVLGGIQISDRCRRSIKKPINRCQSYHETDDNAVVINGTRLEI
ncbi:hypothetical protein CAPTEDRAFT_207020 [Capitella teleta]|uniref:Uncharacterized protein n=1 Tax=Capitella teleta TaxID=283909 RepID=R7UYC1_CAPTE|nr:hypothetical protein CAPTEDRAFT_207020 [Capitella teleta]|eukprot:ELU08942.1 hypothetical protein CAPTEDRAFT_207020 [Capitella teleta]